MLSVKECRKHLEQSDEQFSDAEIEEIRDLLYKLAKIEYEQYKIQDNEKTGGNIHKGLNG